MYERFTERARKVMQLANQEAQRFNHQYIGSAHILLGLVKEGAGIAAVVLKSLDIDLRKTRLQIERIVPSGPYMVTMGKLIETPRAKKVIEYSMEEARNLHHNYVGTEHLLLGLLHEQTGVAAQVLMNLGLKLEEVREEVMRILGVGMDVREAGHRRADLLGDTDLNTTLMYLPAEVILSLQEISFRIEKVVQAKQEAVADQDFDKAARLRDKEDRIKRQVRDRATQLQILVRELQGDSE